MSHITKHQMHYRNKFTELCLKKKKKKNKLQVDTFMVVYCCILLFVLFISYMSTTFILMDLLLHKRAYII